MTDVVLFRRRGLGLGSCRGLKQWGAENDVNFYISTHEQVPDNPDLIVRWGNRQSLSGQGIPNAPVLNSGATIGAVNSKAVFAGTVTNCISGQLPVVTQWDRNTMATTHNGNWVVRPPTHAQGRNFHLVHPGTERECPINGSFYARPFIQKEREFRVYVMCGRVVTVAEKIPRDRSAPAWNSNTRGASAGSEFVNVRWHNWPIHVVKLACQVAHLAGIHFTGVDIMTEQGTDSAYFIEANSAPSLPLKTDGTYTNRHKCVGKAIKWTAEHSTSMMECDEELGDWRSYIHPGVSLRACLVRPDVVRGAA